MGVPFYWRKSGRFHFFGFLKVSLRLWRGQPPLQRKPCFASAFADPAYMPPDPNKATGGCGPRTPKVFIGN